MRLENFRKNTKRLKEFKPNFKNFLYFIDISSKSNLPTVWIVIQANY